MIMFFIKSQNSLESINRGQLFFTEVDLNNFSYRFNLGQYNNIVVTVKDDLYKIFINGNEVLAEKGAMFLVNDIIQAFWVMGADWSEYWLGGKIDELAVYNRALNIEEIQNFISYH